MAIKRFLSFLLAGTLLSLATVKGQTAATGNVYADASTLYTNLYPVQGQTGDAQTVSNILSYYCGKKITSGATLTAAFATTNNTFFSAAALAAASALLDARASAFTIGTAAGLPAVPAGFNATNILQGATQFLISRGQQELSMAFFTRFQKALQKYPELTYLFPKTCNLINRIENYNLINLLQQLRDLFQKDLLNMPANILSLRNMTFNPSTCGGCDTRVNNIKTTLSTGPYALPINAILTIVQSIINGDNVVVALNKTAANDVICGAPTNIGGYIKLCDFIAQVLQADKESDGVFINGTKLQSLFSNKELLGLFAGLAYQKYVQQDCFKDAAFKISFNGDDYHLRDILQKMIGATDKVYTALADIFKINASFLAIKQDLAKGSGINFTNYGAMVTATFQFTQSVAQTIGAGILGGDAFNNDLIRLQTNLNTAIDICTDVQQKNYTGIFNDVIKFISDNEIIADGDAQKKIITYLSFGSNLAAATTPDQVKNALEAVALPSGSYSIKQKSSFNISLNGYIGYGWDNGNGHGIHAPIGLAFSFGTDKVAGGAATIFASIIDLGGIAAYQLNNNNNTTGLKQDITFESVISPSLQGFYEIPKWPLAVGGGWRMTPKLIYTDGGGLKTITPVSTFHISVLIDIPIFTLYNRPFGK